MSIEDLLFEMKGRDLQVTPIQIFHDEVTNTFASTAFLEGFEVPADRILAIRHYSYKLTPGAGQSISDSNVVIHYEGSSFQQSSMRYQIAQGANVVFTFQESVDFYLPPKSLIRISANFSAAANPNRVDFSVSGILIPRGNFAV